MRPRSILLKAPLLVVWPFGEVEHPRGSLIIGRAPEADIVLDDPLVSRAHARLMLSENGATVEDLHSSNGVFVNGVRIVQSSSALMEGDRLLVGTTEISLFSALASMTLAVVRPNSSEPTPPASRPEAMPSRDAPSSGRKPSPVIVERVARRSQAEPLSLEASPPQISFDAKSLPATQRADAVDMIGRLAERLMASGRRVEAVRVLAEHLKAVSLGVSSGLTIPDSVFQNATTQALQLFEWTRAAEWIDYVFEMHLRCQRLPEAAQIEAIASALQVAGPSADGRLINYFVESLWARWALMSSEERTRFSRLAELAPRR